MRYFGFTTLKDDFAKVKQYEDVQKFLKVTSALNAYIKTLFKREETA